MINSGMNKQILTLLGIIALAIVLSYGLSSCQEGGERIVPTIDRVGEDILVRVYFYNSSREVTAMYRQLHNIPRNNPMPEMLGFAMWPEWRNQEGESASRPDDEAYECEIHTTQPRFVNDNATMTLGHELLHCVWGSYHREHSWR